MCIRDRPILDYCSVVYLPVLTDDQDQKVERLQAAALCCIYGYNLSYKQMRELANVTTLRERRIKASDKFANKCLGNTRFSAWFPARTTGRSGRSSRVGEQYAEDYTRCNRLWDSPLFFMQRSLNGKAGKSYGERNKEYRDGNSTGRSDTRPIFKKTD